MSTQGSAEGFQSSVHCRAGEVGEGGYVCIQTGWGIGNVNRMEPGRRNWVPTTPALAPLWDVTVGEPWLFSRITEILAEIEQKWKCGWWIPCRATRAHYTHARTQEHTHTHKCSSTHVFNTLMFVQMKSASRTEQISQLGEILLVFAT